MRRSRTRRISAVAAAITFAAGLTAASGKTGALASPAVTPLPGSAVPFAVPALVTGAVPAGQRLTVQVWLRPRTAAAQRFATAVSTPGGRQYGHFLSPDAWTARFGASRGEATAVTSWLRRAGFTGVHTDAQRDYVRATAATPAIEAAFGVRLRLYRVSGTAIAGRYPLRANDRPVSVPAALAAAVTGVTGLDNASPLIPLARRTPAADQTSTTRCSHWYGQHRVTGQPQQFGVTSFPTDVCGYSAGQLRTAYGVTSATAGQGQRIALVELGLTADMFQTLRDYAHANGMPAPTRPRWTERSLGRGDACGDPFDGEEQMDVEAAYDMAPAAHQFVIGGDSCNEGDYGQQGLLDADLAVLAGDGHQPLATVASNSWETGGESQAAGLTSIEHAVLVRAAGEGVGEYFSTGDDSGVEEPASDPYAVAVGGDTLAIGRTGETLFATGWSNGVSTDVNGRWALQGEVGAAGGGPSLLWRQPSWQRHVVPPALARVHDGQITGRLARSGPDLSADADQFTPMAVGFLTQRTGQPPVYSQEGLGGTSLAAPLVAGMVTAAQQGQPRPFGFLDPALYRLSGTAAFTDPLPVTSRDPAAWRGMVCPVKDCGTKVLVTSDDQSTHLYGYTGQVTRRGYDTMTGVGAPADPAFATALRQLAG